MLVHEGEHLLGAGDRVQGAWRERRTDLLRHVAGRYFIAEFLDGLGRRPDPGQARTDYLASEFGVLGEETVAGVDRISA